LNLVGLTIPHAIIASAIRLRISWPSSSDGILLQTYSSAAVMLAIVFWSNYVSNFLTASLNGSINIDQGSKTAPSRASGLPVPNALDPERALAPVRAAGGPSNASIIGGSAVVHAN
jgi:hypothetical protein